MSRVIDKSDLITHVADNYFEIELDDKIFIYEIKNILFFPKNDKDNDEIQIILFDELNGKEINIYASLNTSVKVINEGNNIETVIFNTVYFDVDSDILFDEKQATILVNTVKLVGEKTPEMDKKSISSIKRIKLEYVNGDYSEF